MRERPERERERERLEKQRVGRRYVTQSDMKVFGNVFIHKPFFTETKLTLLTVLPFINKSSTAGSYRKHECRIS